MPKVKSYWVTRGVNISNILSGRNLPQYVYFRKNRYEVTTGKEYHGRYETLQEAKQVAEKL